MTSCAQHGGPHVTSCDEDVRRGGEEHHGGDEGEEGEGEEADAVQHDSSVLPVVHCRHRAHLDTVATI